MPSAREMTIRCSPHNPDATLLNPMAKKSHLPISTFGHTRKVFSSSPHQACPSLSPVQSPPPFAKSTSPYLTILCKGKARFQENIFSAGLSSLAISLLPLWIQLSPSTPGGIKQFSQALVVPELQHWVSSEPQSHQTPVIPSTPSCRSCGQLKDQ